MENVSPSIHPKGHLSLAIRNGNDRTGSEPQLVSAELNRVGELLLESALCPTPAIELSDGYGYWVNLAKLFLTKVRELPDPDGDVLKYFGAVVLTQADLQNLLASVPAQRGIEYFSEQTLALTWTEIRDALLRNVSAHHGGVEGYLKSKNDLWALVGRVFFHLAENKLDERKPFAFLATYTTRISDHGKVQHTSLGKALQQFGEAGSKNALLAMLVPVHKASAESSFLKELIDQGKIYQPQPWSSDEAFKFLSDIPIFESFGIGVRVPNWWNPRKPSRPTLQVTVGEIQQEKMGLDALLDFSVECSINGEKLSEKELHDLLGSGAGLVRFKGNWVEVDDVKLKEVIQHWKELRAQAQSGGISLAEGLRMLAHAPIGSAEVANNASWKEVRSGAWLSETLEALRNPKNSPLKQLEGKLNAKLRPYQESGVRWLWYLYSLRIGGCLADDMGLGKTLQIIAFLLLLKSEQKTVNPALLVLPASLIGNWRTECDRFAPTLSVCVAHTSVTQATDLEKLREVGFSGIDLVITTYGTLHKQSWATEVQWALVILDEAQAIKNSQTQQTKKVKALKSSVRFALTGTPVENRVADLWSLFDFLNPGLLGSWQQFSRFMKEQENRGENAYGKLRSLVNPYLLRRLKTDKRIIEDLPDKSEVKVFCGLSTRQIALYRQGVKDLAMAIDKVEGIKRRGIIFSFLMRFKQLCNHPSQWLGDGEYRTEESGKMDRLRVICEEISARQEKVLIFSQFSEILDPLANFVQSIFGRAGLILSGETPVKKRKDLVNAFQSDSGPPFFLLSLKAGGTGLNLTAASHVIHFDRWWNPAVENQATDRAFRIGQKRNVLVHKFVCQGTIEEKIDTLLTEKQGISNELLAEGGEKIVTDMTNEELLSFVALDLSKASS